MKKNIFSLLGIGLSLLTLSACGSMQKKTTTTTKTNPWVRPTTTPVETTNASTPTTSGNNSLIGTKIELGTFPQSELNEVLYAQLIGELNTYADGLPSSSDFGKWTSYGKNKTTNKDYMFYIDVDKDNDGSFDYRGVYFTEYRSGCYQEENGYKTLKTYWFSYDPISWTIYDVSGNDYLLMCDIALDSRNFTSTKKEGYTKNNYEQSDIRSWLNNDLYGKAFSGNEKEQIKVTKVLNDDSTTYHASNSTTVNPNICNDTNDDLFLLSYSELSEYRKKLDSRKIKGSSYAKCRGLEKNDDGYCSWLTRTPSASMEYRVGIVRDDGYFFTDMYNCDSEYFGVVPALWITKK